MSERDIFLMYSARINELVADCQKMTKESYDNWKKETLAATPDQCIGFMKKIFMITDKHSGHLSDV